MFAQPRSSIHDRHGMPTPRTYVADLSHFLDSDGQLVSGAAGKLGHYLGLIVERGSVMAIRDGGLVAVPCSNPSRRRRCGVRLAVGRSSRESIEWRCPACGENGVIQNWYGTLFDLGVSRCMLSSEDTADAVVLFDELWAMRRLGGGIPAQRRLLVEAIDIGGGYFTFFADHEELEELRDGATEAADRARRSDRRFLDRFAARMDAFRSTLPSFIDEEEPPLDLTAAVEAGTSPDVIALAREIAAKRGDGPVMVEDMMEAEDAHRRGRRPVFH